MSPSARDRIAPTLVDALCALEGDGERGFVFVRADGTERLCTFRDMAREAARRAAALLAIGLDKGDRVALAIPDGEEFVLSLLGTLFGGLVPVPLNPQLSFNGVEHYHDTVSHVARAAGAAVLLTTAAARPYLESAVPLTARVRGLRAIVTVEALAACDTTTKASVSPDDLALIQFTSGSTSRPKGVMVTHRNLAANSEAFMIHGLERDARVDKGVSWLPLFHDMGLIGFVVGPIFANVPCVLLSSSSFARRPRLWLDKIHQHRGTITYAPNFAYALVSKRLKGKDIEELDLSCVRVSGCGAEPIHARVLRDFAATVAPARFDARALLPSYGMAEATLAITFAPLGRGALVDRVDPESLAKGTARVADEANETGGTPVEVVDCGRAFPGHEVAIVDSGGRRVADRTVGQIVTRGPSVSAGYFGDPSLTDETFKLIAGDAPEGPRWLHTGDLGYMVGPRLFVCGRVKDVIIVRGRNYHPSDIEWAVADAVSAVTNATNSTTARMGVVVAFGVFVDGAGNASTESLGDERLVVCCEGHSADAEAIREAASAVISLRFGLSAHEVVVAALASLPRTSSGKPRRRQTRATYLDGSLPRARTMQPTPGQAAELGNGAVPTQGQPSVSFEGIDAQLPK